MIFCLHLYDKITSSCNLPSILGQDDAWEEDETLPDASSSFPAFACVRSRSSCTPSSAEQSDNHDDDDDGDDDD